MRAAGEDRTVMLHLEPWDSAEAARWDQVVASFRAGTAYHSWAWMEMIAQIRGAAMMPFGIRDDTDLVGVLPMFRVHHGPFSLISSCPGGTGYGGPLLREAYHAPFLEQFERLIRELRADYAEFHSLQALPLEVLRAQRFAARQLQTLVIPLQASADELWARLDRGCRRAIKKACKSGIEVSEADDDSFFDTYWEMSQVTWGRSGRPPVYSRTDLQIAWDMLRPRGQIRAFVARLDGRVIAALFVLCFNGRIYGWDRAGFREYYSLGSNNLIDWTVIEWGARQGMRSLDMMGANTSSFTRYKASFGGELRTYIAAAKDVTHIGRIARPLYLKLKPWLRRLRWAWQRTLAHSPLRTQSIRV